MEVLRLERAVVLARKSKPAWGLRLNGPRERICFASSYFIPGFSGFSLFLDCDAEQLDSTRPGIQAMAVSAVRSVTPCIFVHLYFKHVAWI
jgi:hypothetical protein